MSITEAQARIALLERAIRAADEAVSACEGIGLLYCMGRVSDEAKAIAAVLAAESLEPDSGGGA